MTKNPSIASCVLLLVSAWSTTASAQAPALSFSDQTAASGINMKYQPGTFPNSDYVAPGACGDFDNDGDQDLFLLSGGGNNGPDRLYINQGDATFVDRASLWGVDVVHRGTSIAVGDYDNDGFLDVYVPSAGLVGAAQAGFNKLYRNVMGQSFTNVAAAAGMTGITGDSFGSSFGDYDLDGDLDLFVTGSGSHKNRLYQNRGDGTFVDVTVSSQLVGSVSQTFGLATRFVDMNGDHYPELLISGDFGTSRYFRNNGNGKFTNITNASGTGKDENGMGGMVGDFDRDGMIDWYVTSIMDTTNPNWTGNKLYHNLGGHLYSEISSPAGVWDGGYGWGTVGVDFDHDRWLDIAEVNGAQWSNQWVNERAYLWINQGNGTFVERSQVSGLNELGQGRGLLNFDYDLDGDQDLLVINNNQPVKLWRNDLQGSNIHWLTIKLDTSADPTLAPNGYGSIVRVAAGGIQQTGHVFGGDNMQSQSELTAHFGLGAETIVTEVSVEWSNGQTTKVNNVAVDQRLTIAVNPVWSDVGGGVIGSAGAVSLGGAGTLLPSALTTLTMGGTTPNAAGVLFVGLSALNAPLYGGTFVPSPDLQIPIATNGTGDLVLAAPWPVGVPSGVSFWMQAWFSDPSAPASAAASNGLKATAP